MRLLIVTPAPCGSTKGNRITAERWQCHLQELGHHVQLSDLQLSDLQVAKQWADQEFDGLVCLHATRSQELIASFQLQFPGRPVVLCLTGTDLHLDLQGHHGGEAKRRALDSISRSTRLVLLEPEGAKYLPDDVQSKVCVIYQSASPVQKWPTATSQAFEICVLGHLRPEKDPFVAAQAAARLPAASRIKIIQIGAALSEEMEMLARHQMDQNPRYKWLGMLPRHEAQHRLSGSRLMVLSSKVEGAPSVISEAIVNGVPILATRIPATIGLLGADYPGLFPVGDVDALLEMMTRAENERGFLTTLTHWTANLATKFEPAAERESLSRLIDSLAG
ncbi:MAG: selenoneine biosynthesis selenosugar synthase SenB [Pirellulaceae bacterium]